MDCIYGSYRIKIEEKHALVFDPELPEIPITVEGNWSIDDLEEIMACYSDIVEEVDQIFDGLTKEDIKRMMDETDALTNTFWEQHGVDFSKRDAVFVAPVMKLVQ